MYIDAGWKVDCPTNAEYKRKQQDKERYFAFMVGYHDTIKDFYAAWAIREYYLM